MWLTLIALIAPKSMIEKETYENMLTGGVSDAPSFAFFLFLLPFFDDRKRFVSGVIWKKDLFLQL